MARFRRLRRVRMRLDNFYRAGRRRFNSNVNLFRRRKFGRKRSRQKPGLLPKKMFGVSTGLLLLVAALLFFTPFGKTLMEKIKGK